VTRQVVAFTSAPIRPSFFVHADTIFGFAGAPTFTVFRTLTLVVCRGHARSFSVSTPSPLATDLRELTVLTSRQHAFSVTQRALRIIGTRWLLRAALGSYGTLPILSKTFELSSASFVSGAAAVGRHALPLLRGTLGLFRTDPGLSAMQISAGHASLTRAEPAGAHSSTLFRLLTSYRQPIPFELLVTARAVYAPKLGNTVTFGLALFADTALTARNGERHNEHKEG
jgi:hypothetical protein